MTREEVEKTYIIKDGLIFTPRFTYIETSSQDGTKDFDYTITATAEEVYQEYLSQQNQTPKPTENELLMLAVAELDAQRVKDKLETQLAIAELTNTIIGGAVNG